MFYSQTFLARKGPLGTVWCAAHLQHKLKRSHYTSTNVFSTAERIMYPEVPIALRMSGHLLLGIVRIYSKQVEYLYQDCSVALIGLANSLNVNQPEGVSNMQTFSVIVPKCCELDKVELGDITRRPGNDHVKSPRKITLPDTPPSVYKDPDELPEVPSESESTPMDEDPHPVVPENPPTNNQGPDDGVGGNTPATGPSIEKIREAPDKTKEFPPIPRNSEDDMVKLVGVLKGMLIKNKQVSTPPSTRTPPGAPASGSHESSETPSGAPQQATLSLPGHGSSEVVVRDTPELILQPSPPVEQQRSRKRRRKMEFYDEITVLSNRIIKNLLEDTSNLIRAKRMRRCDKLGIWKQQTRLKKDSMFTEPLITGLSPEILRSPRPNMSPPYMPMPSPSRPDENTPPTTPKSTPPINHDTKSPYNSSPAGRGVQNSAPSDIPEWTNSPGQGLNFLNQDSPPAGTPESIIIGEKEVLEFGTLPATTRAVGQYLKRQSSGTPHSEYSSEILSLHSILENKTRKTCARMFFETLVLKSFGFVDVQQEEPYTDINLKVTSKLKQQGSH